jgi:hypothetical protein
MISNLKTFVSVEELRSVGDWARSYTWNICFSQPESSYLKMTVPPIFSSWFPATDCNIGLNSIEKQDFSGSIGNFAIPVRTSYRTITVTVLDDYKLQVSKWMNDWLDAMTNSDIGYVLPLKDCCCSCCIINYDSKNDNIKYGIYKVFPAFNMAMARNSSGDIVSNEYEFCVAAFEKDIFS